MAPKPARVAGVVTGPGRLTCLIQKQLQGLGLTGGMRQTSEQEAPLGCVSTSFHWCEISQVGDDDERQMLVLPGSEILKMTTEVS